MLEPGCGGYNAIDKDHVICITKRVEINRVSLYHGIVLNSRGDIFIEIIMKLSSYACLNSNPRLRSITVKRLDHDGRFKTSVLILPSSPLTMTTFANEVLQKFC